MNVVCASAAPFFKNGYLLSCEHTAESVLVDPGDEVDQLLASAERQRLKISAILLTHAHLDHVTGVKRAKAVLGVDVWLHPDDAFLYDRLVDQGRMFGLEVEPAPPIDRWYGTDEIVRFGRYEIHVLPTPGHCPGGVCLAVGANGETIKELFVGDTLFAGSIGRTDLPGGDLLTLLHSIRSVLFSFPDDTVVHSGHGPDTTIGTERLTNPFLT
jgi:glyoxylase-like metal-dependent hydrolase (beta-lactamase superfamily II)